MGVGVGVEVDVGDAVAVNDVVTAGGGVLSLEPPQAWAPILNATTVDIMRSLGAADIPHSGLSARNVRKNWSGLPDRSQMPQEAPPHLDDGAS